MSLIKHFGQALGTSTKKSSLLDAVKAGGWKVLIDGNLAESVVAHGPGGTLVGTDEHGNKYFEKVDAQSNRNRWVVYAESTHYTNQNPTVVPPEWHGWLHYITDENPANGEFKRPRYHLEAKENPSFSGETKYQPKGAWGAPHHGRSWRKWEKWVPPSTTS